MWFKNLQIYRLTRPFGETAESLEQQLATLFFKPCTNQAQSSFGWISPLGKQSENMAHVADGQFLICAQKEEKILPSSVVNDIVAEKVAAIELEQGRRLNKKGREQLREDAIIDLLPHCFSRYQQTYAWVNPTAGWVVVDASSSKRAEDLLALLRKSIGSLPAIPLAMTTPPELTMTEWLKSGAAPTGFHLEDEAEFRCALLHGGIVRAKRQDLLSEEIKGHLEADKLVTSLSVNWAETLSFVLKDDMSIKRLKFAVELREQNDDVTSEDPLARFDADFALVAGELSRFIPDLITALGGEEWRADALEPNDQAIAKEMEKGIL